MVRKTVLSYLAQHGFAVANTYLASRRRFKEAGLVFLPEHELRELCSITGRGAPDNYLYGFNIAELAEQLRKSNVVLGSIAWPADIRRLRKAFPDLCAVQVRWDIAQFEELASRRGESADVLRIKLEYLQRDAQRYNQQSGLFDRVLWRGSNPDFLTNQLHALITSIAPDATTEDLLPSPLAPASYDHIVLATTLERSVLAKRPEELFRLTPRQFEELIADLLAADGFDVELTPLSRDGGVDIIAIKNSLVMPHLCLVQCKRYSPANPVGVEPVQRLYGVLAAQRANAALIATTSRFTRGARQFKESVGFQLSLQDYQQIVEWLKRVFS